MTQAVYTKLPDRAFIRVSGTDRFDFLQGLITQDIELLKTQNLIYSCLLTPNGKFLFDFFIHDNGDTLIIDCEGGERANALVKRLSMFKLRSDIALELDDDVDVYQVFNGDCDGVLIDPRLYGHRAYNLTSSSGLPLGYSQNQENSSNKSWNDGLEEVDFSVWDEHRIRAEIPDGSRDLIPEKSFIHESETIINTAVSYDKGCYMGQELVSRMHHRGLVKKQLRCVEINSMPDGAELRSGCNGTGLALLRI